MLNTLFHLLVRPTETNISRLARSLLDLHTQRYQMHYCSGGHLWRGRFNSPVIQHDEHLLTVLRYIEANPLLCRPVKRDGEYAWSNRRDHALGDLDELVYRLRAYEAFLP